jgi:hypothetical protein
MAATTDLAATILMARFGAETADKIGQFVMTDISAVR